MGIERIVSPTAESRTMRILCGSDGFDKVLVIKVLVIKVLVIECIARGSI
jgi:hypothetical protein